MDTDRKKFVVVAGWIVVIVVVGYIVDLIVVFAFSGDKGLFHSYLERNQKLTHDET